MAYGLADLAMVQERPEDLDEAIVSAEGVQARYCALWEELTATPELMANDRQAIRARVRRLNDLGFWVDEIELEPTSLGGSVRMKVAVTNRTFHARRLERLTGLVALEGQARLLLNDLREYSAWLEYYERRTITEQLAAQRWLSDVLEPTLAELKPLIGPERDPLQAYCDVLEEKWILSETAGRDVGLRSAIEAYLQLGAPAPEAPDGWPVPARATIRLIRVRPPAARAGAVRPRAAAAWVASPGTLEQRRDLVGAHRWREEVALRTLAAERLEPRQLVGGLDALGRDLQVERGRERQRRRDDGRVLRRAAEPRHERAIDLQALDREALEVLERREAGPEVVDHDLDAHVAQLAQRAVAGGRLVQHQRLGDLDDQRRRLEPRPSRARPGSRR